MTLPGMYYASVESALPGSSGLPRVIHIEVAMKIGIPDFHLTGLAPSRARSILDRVTCALQMTGIRLNHRTVNLNVEGESDPRFQDLLDLPVAVALLQALGYTLPGSPGARPAFIGKLALDGQVRILQMPGRILAMADLLGFHSVLSHFPETVPGIAHSSCPVQIESLKALFSPEPEKISVRELESVKTSSSTLDAAPDSSRFRFSWKAMRAAVAASAGRHSLLCMGPPGSGKTTLAHAIYDMLPVANARECREIYLRLPESGGEVIRRPFRRPHHSVTRVAMIGGGSPIRAGEVTEAHNGLLLLDELGEFRRDVLQSLREPLDSQMVHISRGSDREELPCSLWFVATANACPCGMFGSTEICKCSAGAVRQYQARMLGALQDRMDMELFLENSESVVSMNVVQVWYENLMQAQKDRWKDGFKFNAEVLDVESFLFEDSHTDGEFDRITAGFSNRKKHRIRRLARSIADMSGAAWIQMEHLLEALRYTSAWNLISQENAKVPSRSD